MKILLSELRALIQDVLSEAMSDHARFAQATFNRVKEILTDEQESISPVRGSEVGEWIIPGEQFGIPEFSNVDFLFIFQDAGIIKDEPLGMYRATGDADPSGNVPEESRRYKVVMSYGDNEEKPLWSKQKFIHRIGDSLNRDTWYHEMGHIVTSKKVPTKPHVKNWSKPEGRGDYEETLGTFIQKFQEYFDKFDGRPEQFKQAFPTFNVFIDGIKKDIMWHRNNLVKGNERWDDSMKRAEKWFLKKAHQVYVDLSEEKVEQRF